MFSPQPGLKQRLKLLSYNIQVGVDTSRYREYVTKGWKHVLPHRERIQNLNRMAAMLTRYDMVSLQEVDAGSLRSGFVDMTEYLAHRAGFPHWYRQVNRNIGVIARHSNGFLTRIEPHSIVYYKLPGHPGRGAMLFQFGASCQDSLVICSAHLALGRRSRSKQLDFLSELIQDCPYAVVMGDLNTDCESEELKQFIEQNQLTHSNERQPTFPSWKPSKKIDHILVSQSLSILQSKVLNYPLSDHLPISVELEIDAQLLGMKRSAQA